MPKQHLNPATLFPSLTHGFSQLVVASGSRIAFISGQTAWDASKKIVGHSLGEQARQALRNLELAVDAAGGTLDDIVSLRLYIVHAAVRDLDGVGSALKDAFPSDPPSSTWIGVSSLAVPDFLIEIEAIAVLE